MRARGQQLAQAARDAADLSAAIAANASQKRRLHAALAAAADRSSAPLLDAHLQRLRWGSELYPACTSHHALHCASVFNTVRVSLQGGREAAGAGGRCRQRQGDHQQTSAAIYAAGPACICRPALPCSSASLPAHGGG